MFRKRGPRILPEQLPVAVLENSPHSCFSLTESLEIAYCNSAWDRFAQVNGGGQEIFGARVLSRNFLDFVPVELKDFYAGLFAKARSLGRPVGHEYECSSAVVFRVFRMDIYPLHAGRGFAVVNSLKIERAHTLAALEPNDATYKTNTGLIRMCANCRRTNRPGDPHAWDWVPEHLGRGDVTHGVCPLCREYYYRD